MNHQQLTGSDENEQNSLDELKATTDILFSKTMTGKKRVFTTRNVQGKN